MEEFHGDTIVSQHLSFGQGADGVVYFFQCEVSDHVRVCVFRNLGQDALLALFLSFRSARGKSVRGVEMCVTVSDVMREVMLAHDGPKLGF